MGMYSARAMTSMTEATVGLLRSSVMPPDHEWAADPQRIRDIISGLIADISIGMPQIGPRSVRRSAAPSGPGGVCSSATGTCSSLWTSRRTTSTSTASPGWPKHMKWPLAEGFAGALLLVTHDRWFLDEVCTEDLGGPRPDRRALRRRVCRLRVLQRVERDRIAAATESEAAESHAQGARVAAPGCSGAHVEAEVPDRRRQPAHRRCAAEVRNPIELKRDGHGPAGQGRRRPAKT
jgi:ATP-binding cassette subfamily F protein uup